MTIRGSVRVRSTVSRVATASATPSTEVEPQVAVPVVVDESHDVVLAEPEPVVDDVQERVAPVPVDIDLTVEAPPNVVRDHAPGCHCLVCQWEGHNPTPVTQGPFAGMAFYFSAGEQVLHGTQPAEPSGSGDADNETLTAARSVARGKRRSLVPRPRR